MNAKAFQAWFYAARLFHPKVKVTPRIPMAQSALEAGPDWNSNLALTANNLFGMKKPTVRKTYATGQTASGFAQYPSQAWSVADYVLFLDQLGLYTDDKLLAYIQTGKYTPDKGYLTKLQRIVNEQNTLLVDPAKIVGLTTVTAIATFFGIKELAKLLK
jgi:flagellum-specific peptidoglycan hydrolase FlgJ